MGKLREPLASAGSEISRSRGFSMPDGTKGSKRERKRASVSCPSLAPRNCSASWKWSKGAPAGEAFRRAENEPRTANATRTEDMARGGAVERVGRGRAGLEGVSREIDRAIFHGRAAAVKGQRRQERPPLAYCGILG